MTNKPVVLITGASAGLGRDGALYLAERGFHVIAAARRLDALEELAREGGHARHITPLQLDVTSLESIARSVEEVDRITDGRGLDVLINNAAIGFLAPIESISDADLRAHFETNFFGLAAMVRAYLPGMRKRGSGRIVNVSSIAGLWAMPQNSSYCSSKHAVEAFTDS